MTAPSIKRIFVGTVVLTGAGLLAMPCSDADPATPIPAPTHPAASSSQVDPRLAVADNAFGLKLFAVLRKQDPGKNIFISPSSIALALAMVYNGAGTTTKDAMATSLGLQGLTLADVNKANSDLVAMLQNPDPEVTLTVANSLWIRSGFPVKSDFTQRLQASYGAEATSLDFDSPGAPATINKWVSDATNQKIPTIVDTIPPDESMFLINAIYFNGTWTDEFNPNATYTRTFTRADGTKIGVGMMYRAGSWKYLANDKFEAIQLPYGSGRLALCVILPSPKSSMEDLVASMDSTTWNQWMGQFREREVGITLPSFRTEYSATLNDALGALGMGIAFDRMKANFSGISDKPVLISTVRHRTCLDVNEVGTEAAAVTSIPVPTSGFAPDLHMEVDRPFVLAIRDDKSGAILFIGAIEDPS